MPTPKMSSRPLGTCRGSPSAGSLREPTHEPNRGLREALRSLNRFGSDTPYPFLLNLYEARDRGGSLTSEAFAEIVRMIEGFLVRRMFANVPTNQLNRLFIRLWDQLPGEGNIVEEVLALLSEPSRRWPTDETFVAAFVSYPLYTDSRGPQRHLVLDKLERSLSVEGPRVKRRGSRVVS